MNRLPFKISRIAAVPLCLLLGAPMQTFAQGDGTPPLQAPSHSPGDGLPAAPSHALPAQANAEAQLLEEEEIAELAQRNRNPGPEVRGGVLSNEHLTYIVIALAAIVLVLVLK